MTTLELTTPTAPQTVSFTAQHAASLADLLGETGTPGVATDVIRAFVLGHPHIGGLVDEAYPTASSLVHLEQEISLTAPLTPDVAYGVAAGLGGARPQRDDTVAGLSCPLLDPATGDVTATMSGAVLLAGVTPVGTDPLVSRRPAAAPADPPVEVRVPVTVDRDFVRTYAVLSGDDNPIHLDPGAAQAAGFEDCIAHGMSLVGLSVARAQSVVTGAGSAPARVSAVSVRFAQPVVVGDEVTIVLQATTDPHELRLGASSSRGPVLKAAWIRFDQPVTLTPTTPGSAS